MELAEDIFDVFDVEDPDDEKEDIVLNKLVWFISFSISNFFYSLPEILPHLP